MSRYSSVWKEKQTRFLATDSSKVLVEQLCLNVSLLFNLIVVYFVVHSLL